MTMELLNETRDCKIDRSLPPVSCQETIATTLELISFILSCGEHVFPNLRVVLQFALMITSCERSFNKLKIFI